MAIPDYQSIMLPLLEYIRDQKEHSLRQTISGLADYFGLSKDERRELLPSGQQAILDNRVAWAKTYLKKAGLLEATRRGFFKISDRGLSVLQQNPTKIDNRFLDRFEEFQSFRSKKNSEKSDTLQSEDDKEQTPEEALENAYQNLRNELATELLTRLKSSPPALFEKTVVDLLVKMGYGGSRKDAGKAIGKSSDEGIDGIIKEDRLGLDAIYIQAKRWENTVGRPEIQKFAGALQGQRARKGIFITTSEFSREAHDYVSKIDTKIVLIDGEQLTQYMIDFDLAVTPVSKYEVKRIDSDYFIEE